MFLTIFFVQRVTLKAKQNEENAKEQIEVIEKENQELVDDRRAQMDALTDMMKEEVSVKINIITEKLLPEDITAQQINKIIKIIE